MKKKEPHIENTSGFPGLRVNEGVEQPPSVDEASVRRFLQKRRRLLPAAGYIRGILEGDMPLLSQAVTLVESARPEHRELAREIIAGCLPHSGKALRVGITGVPGAGKSTFIEALGTLLTREGHRLAVLAIDPSSERSQGSILGDKTRMEKLSADPRAYIRPSPSAGSLGGVARKTRETALLCEAAGFDILFIETVGVGQSEVAVHSMTDFFLLLMIAGAGDELQGIKRGIMEMADLVAINKADGSNRDKAELARTQYRNALQLFPAKESGWEPVVQTCSAIEKNGIREIWDTITAFTAATRANGAFDRNRQRQASYWMYETIHEELQRDFYHSPGMKERIRETEIMVLAGAITSFEGAAQLLNHHRNKRENR